MQIPRSYSAFNLLFAGVALLMLYISLPDLGMFVLAFVFVVITDPLYLYLQSRLKYNVLAAIVSTLTTVMMLLIPLYFFLVVAVGQITSYVTALQTELSTNPDFLLSIQDKLNNIIPALNLAEYVGTALLNVAEFIQTLAVPIISGGVTLAMGTVFFLITTIYFYLEKDNFLNFLKRMIPLPDTESEHLINQIVASTNTIIRSIAASALAQAVASIILYAVVGIPALAFWFFALFFAAFLPLGSGLISVPIAFILMFTGHFWGGVALLVWHVLIVASVDNVVRGAMFKAGAVRMPELVTLLATIGGIFTFGFFGIIYGPLIAIVFIACLEIYGRPPSTLLDSD
jgi:predicted PurR-regulated permease PerM